MSLGHLLTCQRHGAERFVKKCHFSDLFNVDGCTGTVGSFQSTKTVFYVALLGGKWLYCSGGSMLEFKMSRQLYILRSRGQQQIDKMKGFRGARAQS